MKYAELEAELRRGKLAPVYWITGEEDYLRDQAVACLKRTVRGASGEVADALEHGAPHGLQSDFNELVFYGDEADGAEILAAAREAPIFSSRRVVVVKAADKLSVRDTESLMSYLKEPSDTTLLVFVSQKLDGRLKFTQVLKDRSVVVECAPLPEGQLDSWIRTQAQRLRLRLQDDALPLLRELGAHSDGTALYVIQRELEKLASYVPSGVAAAPADVERIMGGVPGASVFDLTSAIADGDRARALQILGRNLEAGEAPLRILGSLIWQYRRLYKAKDLMQERRSDAELARALAVPPYRLRDMLTQTRRFSNAYLRRAFELLLKADSDLKGGSGGSSGRVLEALLMELSGDVGSEPRPLQSSPSQGLAERRAGTPISNVRTIRSGKTPGR